MLAATSEATVDNRREQEILDLVKRARQKADAIIVVGILPGGRFFYDCNNRITLPDLHGALNEIGNLVCESVSRKRNAAKERK